MKLNKITFALLVSLLLCACQKEESPVTPTPTDSTPNEYTIGDKTAPIGSVVKYDYEEYYVFALYEQKGITEIAEGYAMEIYIKPSVLGQKLDLGVTTESGDASLSIEGLETPTGTLEVTWDEIQKKVLIQLNAEENGISYTAYYNGVVNMGVGDNQYRIGDKIESISSVVRLDVEGGSNFYLYEQEGITAISTDPAPIMEIFVAETSLGQELNLETIAPEQALLSVATLEATQWSGSLTVSFAGTQGLKVVLKAQSQEGVEVRANYSGAYATTYVANTPHFMTTIEGVPTEYGEISSVLRQIANGQAGYAFTDIQVATPAECRNASVGVWFTVGATTEGTVELNDKSDFKFIDYLNNKTYDKTNSAVESGTVTIKTATDGKVYFSFNVTLKRYKTTDVTIDAEYFGEVVGVADLKPMLPPLSPGFYDYNQDGELSTEAPIDEVTCTMKNGLLEFTFGNTDPNIASLYGNIFGNLKLTISSDFINAGVIDLSQLEPKTFEIRTPYFTLYSPDNEWKNTPNNGILEVARDDAGNYTISLDVQNYYTKGESEVQGDPRRAVIYYKGAVTEK